MKSYLVHAFTIGLLLASSLVSAKAEFRSPQRELAQTASIDLTQRCPDQQRVLNQEALKFYHSLTQTADWPETDRLNLEEFKLQSQSLEKRGYSALHEPLKGAVKSAAQSLTLRRDKTLEKKSPAGSETVVLHFDYEQTFVKTNSPPKALTPVPKTILRGTLYLHCDSKANAPCPIETLIIHESSLKWERLPSGRIGGESSAGG